MNRRTFFRFFGRASATVAAIVVGWAALFPKMTGSVEYMTLDGRLGRITQSNDGSFKKVMWAVDNEEQWKSLMRKLGARAKKKNSLKYLHFPLPTA